MAEASEGYWYVLCLNGHCILMQCLETINPLAPTDIVLYGHTHLHCNTGQQRVRDWIQSTQFPDSYQLSLPPTAFLIPNPTPNPNLTAYLVIHIPQAISEEGQSRLLEAWETIKESQVRQKVKHTVTRHADAALDCDEHHQDTVSQLLLHLLAWRKGSTSVQPTAETVQKGKQDLQLKLLQFCALVGKIIGPRAKELLKSVDKAAIDILSQ
jgi:hypothetical protein